MSHRLILVGAVLVVGCHPMPMPSAPRAVPATASPAPSLSPVPAPPPVAEAPAPASVDKGTLSPAQIAAQSTASIVLIKTPTTLGTGFIVGPEGRIATNFHVIRGAREATIIFSDGHESSDVEVYGVDEGHDLALLGVRQSTVAALPLGDSQAVKPGEHVVAIGHPLGLGNTVSDGLVSAIRVIDENLTVLQISAPISEGSSGGPLLDEHGRVIGVSTLIITKGQNLNFGVPIAYLKPLLDVRKSVPLASMVTEHAPASPTDGSRGVRVREIPVHPISLLNACPEKDVKLTITSISQAISLGAPLYNEGNHEACFRIYEDAAMEIQRRIKTCAGIKKALKTGIQRARGHERFDDKAWAMRDAFDGLIDVVGRKLGE